MVDFLIKVAEAVFIILIRDGVIRFLKDFKKQSKRTSLTSGKRKNKGGSKN